MGVATSKNSSGVREKYEAVLVGNDEREFISVRGLTRRKLNEGMIHVVLYHSRMRVY